MIKFGPSGNSDIFYNAGYKTSLQAPSWLKQNGLNAYEYSFGRMFNMSIESAEQLGKNAVENNILVSVHAPYYINFANPEQEAHLKNINYILRSLEYLKLFKGKQCVFHPGSQKGSSRSEALKNVLTNIDMLLEQVYANGFGDLEICPETMGKSLQIGSVEEIVQICKLDKILIPTLDFGHINAVTLGTLKSEDDYRRILDYCYNNLGKYKTKNLHIHFSKIQFGEKGEIKHLTLEDNQYGPEFEPLAKVLKEMKLEPTIICESKGMMMEDALKLKNIYEKLGGF